MALWNPWRGCHKFSDGCRFCYIHKGDAKRNVNTGDIVKTTNFDAPIQKNKTGAYKMKPNQRVYVCFSTDFLLEDADIWRADCWKMIAQRKDLEFLFLTKRIHRFMDCIPEDWGQDGYENVIVGCTIENQVEADKRLPIFSELPIHHKIIICQPLLTELHIEPYLKDIEQIVVGGESDHNARPLYYDWILSLRQQALAAGVPSFELRQLGTHFVKDGKHYCLKTRELTSQAKKAAINFHH